MTNQQVTCKYCQSTRVRKYGFIEGVQTYFCNDCHRKFKVDDRLFRMKTPYLQVASALDDYYTGKSIGDICESQLIRHHNRPSTKTIYSWIVKYTNEAVDRFKDAHPQVGDTLVADETVIKLDGKNHWCIDIIDRDTRYLIATKLSPNREMKDIKALMEQVREVTGKVPKRVLTDGWRGYVDGIELAFGADARHIVTDPFSREDNTELIERWHSTLKERTKVLRGLKSVETADRFLDGFCAWYNYMRPHESLQGRTPAEVAGIAYDCRSWVDVVRTSKPHVQILTTPAIVDILSERKPLVRPIMNRNYDIAKKRMQRHVKRIERSIGRKPRTSKRLSRSERPMPSLGRVNL